MRRAVPSIVGRAASGATPACICDFRTSQGILTTQATRFANVPADASRNAELVPLGKHCSKPPRTWPYVAKKIALQGSDLRITGLSPPKRPLKPPLAAKPREDCSRVLIVSSGCSGTSTATPATRPAAKLTAAGEAEARGPRDAEAEVDAELPPAPGRWVQTATGALRSCRDRAPTAPTTARALADRELAEPDTVGATMVGPYTLMATARRPGAGA
mmetsp:Transcript_751/g.1978  ORF Transcript_751/g.1978 Transcript_751/m.1978 type:complete len:216 (+) Transcript_751:49-696(+)